MRDFIRDFGMAVRGLMRAPRQALPAVLMLALGIAGMTSIFALVKNVLLDPLPVRAPEELVLLEEVGAKGETMLVSYDNFEDWRARATSWAALEGFIGPFRQPVQLDDEAISAAVGSATREFVQLMGIRPVAGRLILPEENVPGGPQVVMLSEHLWRTHFHGRRDLENLRVRMSGTEWQVVGVLPDDFRLFATIDVWSPAEQAPFRLRSAGNFRVVGRLRAGTTLGAARSEMDAIAQAIRSEYGDESLAATVNVVPLTNEIVGAARDPLLILLGASGLLLLVACLNVSLLLLARAAGRVQEVAVRTALGASRMRIARQLIAEHGALALMAAALGIPLTVLAVRLVRLQGPPLIPRLNELAVDERVLGFALGTSLLAVLVFGVTPALRLARESFDPLRSMRGSSRGLRLGPWNALVAGQAALAVIMLVSAGLLVRSLSGILNAETGYDRTGVVTAHLPLPNGRYDQDGQRLALIEDLLAEARALPGVQHVALVNQLPLEPGARRAPVLVPPYVNPEAPDEWDGVAGFRVVTTDYLNTLRIPLVQGRWLDDTDTGNSPVVTVVNRALANKLWPGEDPIGKQLRALYDFRGEHMTVVGVVGDARDWRNEQQPEMYVSVRQRAEHAYAPYLLLRGSGDLTAIATTLRSRIRARDPEIPVITRTLEDQVAETFADRTFTTGVLLAFAIIVLLLTLAGVYGVVSYAVSRRTREVGIRIAIGAEPRGVVRLLQRGTAVPVVVGVIGGIALAALFANLLRSQLFAVEPYDALAFGGGASVVLLAGWLASFIPARRAAHIDPIVTMKAE